LGDAARDSEAVLFFALKNKAVSPPTSSRGSGGGAGEPTRSEGEGIALGDQFAPLWGAINVTFT
jgi:hypothetical protein